MNSFTFRPDHAASGRCQNHRGRRHTQGPSTLQWCSEMWDFYLLEKISFKNSLNTKEFLKNLMTLRIFFCKNITKFFKKKNDNKDICSVRNDHHRGTGDRVRAVRPVWRSRGDRSWHLSAHRRSVGRRWIDRPFA